MNSIMNHISSKGLKVITLTLLTTMLVGFTSSSNASADQQPKDEQVAPSELVYSQRSVTYTIDKTIVPNIPNNSGSKSTQYYASPALPIGLDLDTNSGVISGTPLEATPEQNYLITATNDAGSITTQIQLAVQEHEAPPTSLFYRNTSITYPIGREIQPNIPIVTGGPITEFEVTPALPDELRLYKNGGYIMDTPTKVQAAKVYTITGKNSAGSVSARVQIAVAAQAVPPTNLNYLTPSAKYPFNQPIDLNFPLANGGAIDRFSISPDLPGGLSLNRYTGVISGTPTSIIPTTQFIVTGTNDAGSITTKLTLSVTQSIQPPANLGYTLPLATYGINVPIEPNTPFSNGGAITEFSITPQLPKGLTLDKTNGVIAGDPRKANPKTQYIVEGKNSAGSTTAPIFIKVEQ